LFLAQHLLSSLFILFILFILSGSLQWLWSPHTPALHRPAVVNDPGMLRPTEHPRPSFTSKDALYPEELLGAVLGVPRGEELVKAVLRALRGEITARCGRTNPTGEMLT